MTSVTVYGDGATSTVTGIDNTLEWLRITQIASRDYKYRRDPNIVTITLEDDTHKVAMYTADMDALYINNVTTQGVPV